MKIRIFIKASNREIISLPADKKHNKETCLTLLERLKETLDEAWDAELIED